MRIPYGEASFRRIRVNGWLYVDNTRYLRPLEDERYAFFTNGVAADVRIPARCVPGRGVFSVSHHHCSRLVRGMAYEGAWRP